MQVRVFKCLLVVLVLLFSCSERTQDFTGVYIGADLKARFEKQGDGYKGRLDRQGVSYPLKARLEEGALKGSFFLNDEEYPFEATLEEDKLTFISADTTYRLKRQQAANPLEKEKKSNPLARTSSHAQASGAGDASIGKNNPFPTKTAGVSGETQWKSYTHSSGLAFQYPRAWGVSPSQEYINIVPDGVAKDQQGQSLEAVFLGSTSADGVQSLQSPQVTQFFDNAVAQMFGNLARQGQGQRANCQLGEAILFNYRGRNSVGVEVSVGLYCVLHQNEAIYLMHAASKEFYPRRSADAGKIFSSLKMGKTSGLTAAGGGDQSLIGTWVGSESSSSSSYGGPNVGSETTFKFVFTADGKVAYGSGTVVFGSSDDVSVHSGRADPNISYGEWSAGNGVIRVKWQDGSIYNYEYSVFQHGGELALKIIFADGKKYFYKQ